MEKFIQHITREAGKKTLKLFGKIGVKYTKKHASDPVTEADLVSHRYLVSQIRKKYPTHRIISEEGEKGLPARASDNNFDNVWIIDPLDGTRNFATSVPLFGILVSYVKKGVIVMSAVYLPYFDEMFFAYKEHGAFLNGKRIHCAQRTTLQHSHGCSTGSVSPRGSLILEKIIRARKYGPFGCNSFGCYAAALAYVACGRRDWMIARSPGVWDLAAPSLLLREAGCKMTNLSGREWAFSDTEIVTANPVLHKEILMILK